MSTDGQGGLTRPTAGGQLLALRRAWAAAGLDPAVADYFEAHGTGTPTGDPVEIAALSQLVQHPSNGRRPVPVGSVKANIGHTKAAAGMAGLLKALAICTERTVPATTGCHCPHPIFEQDEVRAALRLPHAAEHIDHPGAVVVGVNSFGFGGVNCHVVVEGPQAIGSVPSPLPGCFEGRLRGELIALQAATREELVVQVERVHRRAATLSRSRLIDLAAACRPTPGAGEAWRACIVAASPQQLEAACGELRDAIVNDSDKSRVIDTRWSWSGPSSQPAVVAYLFPGQGLALDLISDEWSLRFPFLAEAAARIAATGSGMDTASVQPRLAEVCIASLTLLARFGIRPDLVLGHSFGELSALHAAQAFDAAAFRNVAGLRGRCMQDCVAPSAMLAIEADRDLAYALAARHGVEVACHNTVHRYVLAGPTEAIAALATECGRCGVRAARLPADRAFHSRLMQEAQRRFATDVVTLALRKPKIPMLSTITGGFLAGVLGEEQLRKLLVDQFVSPVKFAEAVSAMGRVDLVIEVGSAPGLGPLVAEMGGPACMPLSAFATSLEPALAAVGAAWVCGRDIDASVLYAGRLLRPYRLEDEPCFLASPCGSTDARPRLIPQLLTRVAEVSPTPGFNLGRSAFDLLQAVICDLAGLARTSVSADSRLLADLHLNSIRARHAVATAARQLGIASLPFNPGEIANASVGDIARHLEKLRSAEAANNSPSADVPMGVEPWVRVLSHRWGRTDEPFESEPKAWPTRMQLDDMLAPITGELRQSAADLFDTGASLPTLLVLPAGANDAVLARLLAVSQELAARDSAAGLLVLQGAQLSNAFLRSVAAESPDRRICVAQYEELTVEALGRGVHEFCRHSRGYSELRLSGREAEVRRIAVLSLERQPDQWLPGPSDVVLVTGGAKGIGAAAAHFLGAAYHCRLALVGRSPAHDPEVAATLAALNASGVSSTYVQVDLADAEATHLAIRSIETTCGALTAVFHAAGINRPLALSELTLADLQATLAAKVRSLTHVLQALCPGQLRLLVGFASIIGEFGLRGEAHYALANEWLVERMRQYSSTSPSTRYVPICWSAWREMGMAAKLDGVLDELARADTRALYTAEAISVMRAILESGHQGEPLIVTGRYGRVPDPPTELTLLHRHRFLEWPRVFYPGIELVADAELSTDTDPYLLDHAPYGLPVFPLVAAIEAMVSAAKCLRRDAGLPVIEDLRIFDAISCSPGQRLVLRTSALVQPDGSIRVSLRCSATDHAVDHFSARLHWNRAPAIRLPPYLSGEAISADQVLYRGLVFHGPTFRRIERYHRIDARGCLARTRVDAKHRWYGTLQAPALAGGDPPLRDSVLHALQACIPQHPVLPVGVARVELGWLQADSEYFISARQTGSDGREFTFDVDVCNQAGDSVERWAGLRVARLLSDKGDPSLRRDIDVALLEPFVGRLLLDTLGESEWQVGVCAGGREPSSSRSAIRRALGPQAILIHRADGAPQVAGLCVSIAHTDELTLAVAHRLKDIACDVETLPAGDGTDWPLMLGAQRWSFARDLAVGAGLTLEVACLVVWSASECLLKLGRRDWPFDVREARAVDAPHTGPIMELRCHDLSVAIGLVRLAGRGVETAIAVAVTTTPSAAGRDGGARDPTHRQTTAMLADAGAFP